MITETKQSACINDMHTVQQDSITYAWQLGKTGNMSGVCNSITQNPVQFRGLTQWLMAYKTKRCDVSLYKTKQQNVIGGGILSEIDAIRDLGN